MSCALAMFMINAGGFYDNSLNVYQCFVVNDGNVIPLPLQNIYIHNYRIIIQELQYLHYF